MENTKANSMEMLICKAAKHPYVCTALACILTLPFGLCQLENINIFSLVYALLIGGALSAVIAFFAGRGKSIGKTAILFISGIAYTVICLFLINLSKNNVTVMFLLFVVGMVGLAYVLKKCGCLGTREFVAILILSGIALRLMYVLCTDSTQRQHDVGYFGTDYGGHSNYIEYWYNNGLVLPDFDVRTVWQFYHPPFHHMIMALLLRLFTVFGMPYSVACEALQILPMTYSSLCMVVSYRLFKAVKLNNLPLVIAMSIVCFHPTFIRLGGSFNNDILSILLILLSVLWSFKWYKNRSFINIVFLALCVGLGMMTKLSAWIVAPPIAFLFLYTLIKDNKNILKYILQYLLFGVICAPLGLWWQFRNFIMFSVPVTYIPYLGENNLQYSGNLPLGTRLLDFFSPGRLDYPFVHGTYGVETNPTLGLFKTAVFDESSNVTDLSNVGSALTYTLFYLSIILFLICTVAFFVSMIRKKSNIDLPVRIFYIILFSVFVISYYSFCFKFPFTCTYNIRYCTPLIVLCSMGLGLMLKNLNNSLNSKIIKYGISGLVAVFCMASCLLYTQYQ